MSDLRAHLRRVRQRPGMFLVAQPSFDTMTTYVEGLDAGASGALLTGFYEFLLLRLGEQSNLAWSGLVERLAFPSGVPHPRTVDDDAVATSVLLDLLDEFLAEIRGVHNLRRLYHEFVLWATEQPGYSPDLIRFSSDPAWPHVTIDQAAAMLRVPRHEIVDRIASGALRTARVGAEVYLDERQVGPLASASPNVRPGDIPRQ